MSRRKKKTSDMHKGRYLDEDGWSIAGARLAKCAPDVFFELLDQAYAHLLIHDPDRTELAKLGCVNEKAGAMAAKMLIAQARARSEAAEASE